MANKKKILIGSADPDFAFGIKSQLEGMGTFSPVLVTGARELIEVEQLFYFSVILLDALLDDFPGFEVCRKLREAGRDTPIILFSRIPEHECAKIRNSWQADRCLLKSIPVPDLFDRIREVIEAKAKSGAPELQSGRRPEEPEEVKFDGLEEIMKEEMLSEIAPETAPEPEIGELPAAAEPEAVPVESPAGPPAREAEAAAEPPAVSSERIPPASEPPPSATAPSVPKTLSEEIAGKLDELELEGTPKPTLLSQVAAREIDTLTLREDPKEAARESALIGGPEVIPGPDSAEEMETIAEEDLMLKEIPEEVGRPRLKLMGEEFVPPLPREALPPMAARKRETARPPASIAGEDRSGLVSWGSTLRILIILMGLGFGLGYFLAK